MFANDFLSYVDGWSIAQFVGLEDLADRANFQANIIALLLCTVLVSVRQYFMEPIICYVSTVPGGKNPDGYITDMCWVEGTVPLNFSLKIPHKNTDWDEMLKDSMNYYQWIPFVLGLQAILYYLPHLFWQIITYNRMGMDLEQLARDACDADCSDESTKDNITEHVARNIEIMLFGHRRLNKNLIKEGVDLDKYYGKHNYRIKTKMSGLIRHLPNKRHGNLLVFWYFIIKLVYCIIGFFQLYLMYSFLRLNRKEGYGMFGHRILYDLLSGKDWTQTQVFPRVGICRHSLEQLGNINQAVAQCLLPINMLNEKIYIFLFFFLSTVLIMTLLSIPLWLYRVIWRRGQRKLVSHCLKVAKVIDQHDQSSSKMLENNLILKKQKDRFVVEFLRQDGNFIIRMLSMNVGDLTSCRIVKRLFEIYTKEGYTEKDLRNRKHPHFLSDPDSQTIPMNNFHRNDSHEFKQILLEKVGNARVDSSNINYPTKPLLDSFGSNCSNEQKPSAPPIISKPPLDFI